MSNSEMNYFEQCIYDDGTYQVWQRQRRGFTSWFEIHKPWNVFGKRFIFRSHAFCDTHLWWGCSVDEIKDKLKKIKEFPSPAVKFTMEL